MQETAIIALSPFRILALFYFFRYFQFIETRFRHLSYTKKSFLFSLSLSLPRREFYYKLSHVLRDRFNEHDGFNEARSSHRCRSLIIFNTRCSTNAAARLIEESFANYNYSMREKDRERSIKRNCPGLEIVRAGATIRCRCVFEKSYQRIKVISPLYIVNEGNIARFKILSRISIIFSLIIYILALSLFIVYSRNNIV